MTEIRFYHLTRSALEQVLPELLEKVLERGWRAVVMASSPERVEALTQHLWTYQERGFLPHGNAKDGHAEDQPVWLTDTQENPNGATVAMLTDGATLDNLSGFNLVCEIFDGNNDRDLATARARWKEYKDADFSLTYWQQTDNGWEKKQ